MNVYEAAAQFKAKPITAQLVAKRDAAIITAQLVKMAPLAQVAFAMALQDVAAHEPDGLAHEIVMKQIDRVTQWAASAYPLSEKQIAVIVRDVVR